MSVLTRNSNPAMTTSESSLDIKGVSAVSNRNFYNRSPSNESQEKLEKTLGWVAKLKKTIEAEHRVN